MSDKVAILAYFEYFLGCPQPCLTKARETKIIKSDLAMGFIGVILAGSASVKVISMGITFTGGACVGARLPDTGFWLSIK